MIIITVVMALFGIFLALIILAGIIFFGTAMVIGIRDGYRDHKRKNDKYWQGVEDLLTPEEVSHGEDVDLR